MPATTFVFAILVPLLFWGAYHYYHDRHRPEPLLNLFACLGLGAAAWLLSRAFYVGLGYVGLRLDPYLLAAGGDYVGLLAYAVLAIGLGEELAKFLPFLLVVLRFEAFDEPLDGIVYASFIAMGFALAENVAYFDFLPQGHALARGFAGPLVHIVFASVWAYAAGCAHLEGRSMVKLGGIGLAASAVLHGLYDFVAIGFPGAALITAALLIAAVWVWRLRLIRGLHAAYEADTG